MKNEIADPTSGASVNGQASGGHAAVSTLPLVCPQCLSLSRAEIRLVAPTRCTECGRDYPVADGIPILIADSMICNGIAGGGEVDERTGFYQTDSAYLREEIPGAEDLGDYLARAVTQGIVLEVGSGAGVFRGFGGCDYCALDYSLSWLRANANGHAAVCASAECIPLASSSCRFVFSFATLEHVPRADLAFCEIDRVLAPGGVAYVAPAWHCRSWAAEGLTVRRYRDLTPGQKIRKALIPLRNSLAWRGSAQIPWRTWRRASTALSRAPTELRFTRLRANYQRFWVSDSDACSSIDSHEGILFFESRGYEILRPAEGTLQRLLMRAGPVIVRKRAPNRSRCRGRYPARRMACDGARSAGSTDRQ